MDPSNPEFWKELGLGGLIVFAYFMGLRQGRAGQQPFIDFLTQRWNEKP